MTIWSNQLISMTQKRLNNSVTWVISLQKRVSQLLIVYAVQETWISGAYYFYSHQYLDKTTDSWANPENGGVNISFHNYSEDNEVSNLLSPDVTEMEVILSSLFGKTKT